MSCDIGVEDGRCKLSLTRMPHVTLLYYRHKLTERLVAEAIGVNQSTV
ncbi:transposase family protein [Rathayibacter iranicus]|uniref:Uncharacterized protein n=1 Tax=Rathayibacter iranicus NCPPB 2253 = VKM Ac-1602 TaxID=1328868 RepID=A0ABX5LAD8_9MICO|nr:transposase family protein [Rathayibacter iranicus]MWV31966.1 hypothetical protein [Rathayibacter iranicus NCPPB 2253 = VKM Ac-1602]PWJ62493.1 hypothetical protein B0H03_111102 [Rathayibacter iranicus NCPPB 2253 = VKM Ac-1602]